MPYYIDIQNQVSLGGKQFPKMGAASCIKLDHLKPQKKSMTPFGTESKIVILPFLK